jgi:histidine kinase/DNA gyrase B/HSP90-like ATPase
MAAYHLKFDNNVVEHLGLKLYQNKPTRVVAEVASNSWDAGAREVQVNMNMGTDGRWLSVIDDGHGMSGNALENLYLIIGLSKRPPSNATPTASGTDSARPQMGRKGIGKLAPFGIARQVDVVTAGRSATGVEITWLRLKLRDVLAMGSKGSYQPEEVFQGHRFEDIPVERDATGQVKAWIAHVTRIGANGLGTLVLMHDLSLGKAISETQLIESLGRRFTVTLRDSFVVKVNGTVVEQLNALPAFEFRIPENGEESVALDVPVPTAEGLVATVQKQVRYWVGFVGEADWSQDQAGIGVYAHGKIAQDRPFTFGSKGQEIWTRYMYGVVEADWLAELPDDLISTDRTSVNWDADAARPLQEWGQKKVGEWARKYAAWRKEEERKENALRMKKEQDEEGASPVTDAEQEQIVELVSRITPRMGKDEEAKVKLIRAVSDAWVQKPMQKLVRDLWSELGETDKLPPDAFAGIVTKLSVHGVPEALNLAVVFAQRAFALTKLHEYVHHGIELDLQRLIERFPWIIEPDAAVLTANQTLRAVVKRAEEEGQIPTGRRTNVGGTSDGNRPDFVFLSSPEEKDIVVVELKNPQQDLTIENRRQLEDYLSFLEAHYPNAKISGVLVGRNPSKMKEKYEGTQIVEWTEVLKRSRARHLELLAAMLIQAGDGTKGDARIQGAMLLGGPEAKQMLDKLAEHHVELRKLMTDIEARAPKGSDESRKDGSEPDEGRESKDDAKQTNARTTAEPKSGRAVGRILK